MINNSSGWDFHSLIYYIAPQPKYLDPPKIWMKAWLQAKPLRT